MEKWVPFHILADGCDMLVVVSELKKKVSVVFLPIRMILFQV